MSGMNLIHSQQNIRGLDINSLFRLYDELNELLTKSPSQQERLRAGKTVARITKELQRRKVSM